LFVLRRVAQSFRRVGFVFLIFFYPPRLNRQ
jgi:hypothetical protein